MSELSRREALKALSKIALGFSASSLFGSSVGERRPKAKEVVDSPLTYTIRLGVNPHSEQSKQVLNRAGLSLESGSIQKVTRTIDLAQGLDNAELSSFESLDPVVYFNAVGEQLIQFSWQAKLGDWTVVNYQYFDAARTNLDAGKLEEMEHTTVPTANLIESFAGTSAIQLTLETENVVVSWTIKNDGAQSGAVLQGGKEERGDYVLTLHSKDDQTIVWRLAFGARVGSGKTDFMHTVKSLFNRVLHLRYHDETESISSSTHFGSLHPVGIFPLRVDQGTTPRPILSEQLVVITDAIAAYIRSDVPAHATCLRM